MERHEVFVVSGDAAVRDSVGELVESQGLQAATFSSLRALLDAAEPGSRGLLVLDTRSDDLRNPEQQIGFADCCARMTVILLAERGDVETAVRAVKAGAMDVIQKPYGDRTLLDSINKALQANAVAHS